MPFTHNKSFVFYKKDLNKTYIKIWKQKVEEFRQHSSLI